MPSRLVLIFFTATLTSSRLAPALDAKSDLLASSCSAICEPTTPQPSMPTLRVFIGEVSQTYESCRGASTTSRFSRSASFSLRKICRALPFSTATTAGRAIWL